MNVVIIGAGPAGITVAETIRSFDRDGSIVVLSSEPHPPYSPPALADYFLTGRSETLFWKGRDVADRLALDYRAGVSVAAIDTTTRKIILKDGGAIDYEALVIASGSRLHAPITGWDLPGVHDFKSLTTAEALIGRVRRGEARSALIVGAGFIGMEIALLLADLGVAVTIVGRRGWLMPRMLDPETAAIAETVMRARGVAIRLGVEASAFEGATAVEGVRLADGTLMTADLYVAATGVKPNIGFLDGSGILTAWGITVDEQLRTSVTGIWAAGDAVEAPDLMTGQRYVHAIFPNALEQGRIAGANVVGRGIRYAGAESMNSLKHLGLPVMAVGAADGETELRWRTGDRLRKIFLSGGRIVGFRFAGEISGGGLLRSLMLRGDDVRHFGRRLVEPGFGAGNLALPAMGL
jgi:NADPH-dependent 2,4-dienoyl-CoA reductase/sulfur reductase-like enzyme